MFFFMIFIISLFLIKGFEPIQTKLKDEDALPKLLVVGIALIGLGLLIANTALVAWFIIRKRIKGKNKTASVLVLLSFHSPDNCSLCLILFSFFIFLMLEKNWSLCVVICGY